MYLLEKVVILLLFSGFFSSAFAAVDGFEPGFCSVYNEAEKTDEDKKPEEEEPDCE